MNSFRKLQQLAESIRIANKCDKRALQVGFHGAPILQGLRGCAPGSPLSAHNPGPNLQRQAIHCTRKIPPDFSILLAPSTKCVSRRKTNASIFSIKEEGHVDCSRKQTLSNRMPVIWCPHRYLLTFCRANETVNLLVTLTTH